MPSRRFLVKSEKKLNQTIHMESNHQTQTNSRALKSHDSSLSCDERLFTLEIDLDNFAEETAWKLVQLNTNTIIALKNYSLDDSLTTSHFETCIEPGPYLFSLNDVSGNGISCQNPSGCYEISVDHEVVIERQPFVDRFVEHTFDSSLCSSGESTFVLEEDIDMIHMEAVWELEETSSNTMIEIKRIPDQNTFNSTMSYFSCLSPGSYTLTASNLLASGISCTNKDNCYTISVDNKPIPNEGKSSTNFTSHFFISNSGLVKERQCGTFPELPILNGNNNNNNIMEQISISGDFVGELLKLTPFQLLRDPQSPQYKAACWILYDDVLQPMSNMELLVERYVFAVFLYATHQEAEIVLSTNTCDYPGIDCGRDGEITRIQWARRRLSGIIPSEIFLLRHLGM